MNLPNKLSLLRILLVPVMVLFMYIPDWGQIAALLVFAIASFTDYLDGHIARSQGIVTNFGKFIDPVADKLLVLSAFVMLCYQGRMPAWAVVVVLARELSVDGLRLIAVEQGKVIAAGPLGKLKTVSQIVCILYLMLCGFVSLPQIVATVLIVWTVFITLWSGIYYFLRSWQHLKGA
ncbi:MAG: CDP-diacylglycerol--glycerol-3-phosphate 3-phosphatidyltransferase [Clostridia bacterium]|nr:CDP-diacylglycerol--glycerol-3-phosphate 3-phosphatidyltransferase [Clostridia bacterium]